MFGLNMLGVYGDYKISFLGGATLNLVVTLVIRLVVGIGWYKMFERAGKTGWLAFVPVLGAYNAFRLTCDDFSWAALFGGTTFIAWVDAVGIEHPIVTGCALPDIIFGSLATFLGAIGSYALRRNRYLCSVPPIVSNALIIPFVLSFAYHIPGGIPYFMLTVGAGEVISCLFLGQILLTALLPVRNRIFTQESE